jgi:HTH-type transcriptional regulator/antitoxin HigA
LHSPLKTKGKVRTMITNERQYKITKSQLKRLEAAIKEFNLQEAAGRIGSGILANAELQALESEVSVLRNQLDEYEALQSGAIAILEASSLEDLPKMLIRARIAQHLSQKGLADLVGLKEQQIQRYEADEYANASLRRLEQIAEALKLTISETAEITHRFMIAFPDEKEQLNWGKFPVKEMYRRGWFEEFSGSLDSAINEADILVRDFVLQVFKKPSMVMLHRSSIRSGSQLDRYALLAWECRVLSLATKTQFKNNFVKQSLDSEWISNLIKASSKDNGPIIARTLLQEIGIALIIEPYLTNTYIDGAALLNGDFPVIGMTLRYDRLDNFWFVLLHELFHIIKHLKKGKLDNVFDDLDAEGKDGIEREADTLAEEALIPSEKWKTALPRYVQSEQSIIDFAADLGTDPSIVAGRIRHEAKNYRILNELVGQGKVRKWFPEVNFGV